MKIQKLEIESEILGRNVYKLIEVKDITRFRDKEASILNEYQPYYIQCSLEAGDLKKIHLLEEAGFRFVEFRYRKILDLNSFHKVDEHRFFPYYIKLISEDEEFKEAKNLVNSRSADDRFSRDPLIQKELSQKRLQAYLKKSYDHFPDEFIYGLYNKFKPGLYAIRTGLVKNNSEVIFGQTSLRENLDHEKYTYMIDSMVISHLMNKGSQFFYSITSGYNVFEMDLHISGLKYRINSTRVILRKIYH